MVLLATGAMLGIFLVFTIKVIQISNFLKFFKFCYVSLMMIMNGCRFSFSHVLISVEKFFYG